MTFAVHWQRQHNFEMEFLYNGGSSARFQVHGTDPLLAAFKPVAHEFFWINHTFTHANLGCKQDFSVAPGSACGPAARSCGPATGLITSQIADNLAWARRNGIPVEAGVLATGEYSGLKILPQQPADNPNLHRGPWARTRSSGSPRTRRASRTCAGRPGAGHPPAPDRRRL